MKLSEISGEEPKKLKLSDLDSGNEKPSIFEPYKAAAKSAFEELGGAGGAYGGAELGAGLGGMVGGPVGALAGGLVGGAGGYMAGKMAQSGAGNLVPESVKQATGFTPEQRRMEKSQYPKSSLAGTLAPDIVALTPGTIRVGAKAVDIAKSLKAPEPIANVKDLSEVGEKGYNTLSNKASKLYEARKKEADVLYDKAFDEARKAQAKGEPFATSQQGRQLLNDLEKEKTVIAGGQQFEKGQDKIAGIDRLINAIKGTTTGGQKVPVGKGLVSSKLTTTTPTKTTEKDIDAIVEELRFLRDVDAKGKTYEAYAALDAKYKRDLTKRLESALHDWNKDYGIADEAYKNASQKLAPFKTELMSRALKGEKFNPKDLVAAPEDFGRTFFSDVDGVRQLKAVTQDPAEVANLGKEYVASVFANKTPAQIKSFVADTRNSGWLKEAGIYDEVSNYANKATTAESRQNILKNIGKYSLMGTVGYTGGRAISSLFGF